MPTDRIPEDIFLAHWEDATVGHGQICAKANLRQVDTAHKYHIINYMIKLHAVIESILEKLFIL